MINLERELKELLRQRADDAAGGAEDRLPNEIRGRVRRRQARTIGVTGLLVGALALGALAGAGALLPTAERRPATDPRPHVVPSDLLPELPVVASGTFQGQSWEVKAGLRDGMACFGARTRHGTHGSLMSSCDPDVRRRPMVASSLHEPELPGVLVVGAISKDVARVVFDLDAGGQVEGTVHPVFAEMGVPFNVFSILVPRDRPARGVVTALDSEGNRLAQHGVYVSRPS